MNDRIRKLFEGRYVRLEPLNAIIHGDGLYEAATDGDADERFRWLSETTPKSRDEFQGWLEMVEASEDPMYFAVIDRQTGKVAGRQTMMRMDPANGVAEIGPYSLGPGHSENACNNRGFLSICLAPVSMSSVIAVSNGKCNNRNEPSKDAALRYGMTAEGVHRQALVIKDENRDTAWFSLLDYEWDKAGKAFEAWLDPVNFDEDGKQKRRLEEIRRVDCVNPDRDYSRMTAETIANADTSQWIAVLPLGAHEQHGPHLPFETDSIIASGIACRLAGALDAEMPVTFLPAEPIGYSIEHMDYAGSKTTRL